MSHLVSWMTEGVRIEGTWSRDDYSVMCRRPGGSTLAFFEKPMAPGFQPDGVKVMLVDDHGALVVTAEFDWPTGISATRAGQIVRSIRQYAETICAEVTIS